MNVEPSLVAALATTVLRAGEVILAIYRDGFSVATKPDSSPVTAADEQAEAVILADLARLLPGVPVVAEEATARGEAPSVLGETFLLVDPLDGTREFVARNGEFTVNVALIAGGRPILGLVYAPVGGEIFVGVAGAGARAGRRGGDGTVPWRPIAVREPPAAGVTAMVSRSHAGAETEALLARLPIAERSAAGSSLKFCRIAAGAADLYPRLGPTMGWDTAAGEAVLAAAGGGVTDLSGRPLGYGRDPETGFSNPWFLAFGDRRTGEAAVRAAQACGFAGSRPAGAK